MAKNKKQEKPKDIVQQKPAEQKAWYKNTQQLAIVILILAVTYICFLPALSSKKEFTNWDDPGYIMDQPLVKDLSKATINKLFKPSTQVMLNYHPLTMISLALNYHYSKLNVKAYVRTNIFIHLFNTLLVFIFLYLLSKKKFWVGALGALWFGIHPMHVESVAWVSERKDVLYCFFFLLSCITYIRYLEKNKWIYLVGVFVLFVLSCLSKAMAVPLPFVLILIDFYYQRKINLKTIAEKIPFLVLAIWIGYNATKIQSGQAIAEYGIFTTLQRIMFAAYGFMMYCVKLIAPINLSAFYPYPATGDDGGIPFIYNIAPFVVLLILFIPFWLLYKKENKEKFRIYVFGMGFFILMIALVLQFISVGAAIMADRYSYLPYIGAFFIIAMFVNDWMEDQKTKTLTIVLVSAFSIFFIIACFDRVKIWTNTEVLWTDVINKHPYVITQNGNVIHVEQVGVEVAYKNRGNYYREHGMMDKAFADYNVLVRAVSKDAFIYSNVGNMYALEKNFPKSLEMYSKAISLNSTIYDTYLNRGITYSTMGKHEEALNDFLMALKLNPNETQLYVNIASERLSLGKLDESIAACNSLLALQPDNSYGYFYRGTCYINQEKVAEGLADLQKAVRLNAENPNAWFNYSVALNKSGNYKAALEAAQKSKALNYAVDPAYLNELIQKVK
jgi:lipoprotein NlpI